MEAKKLDGSEIPAISETNKQEITETVTSSKYGKLIGGIIGFTVLALFFLLFYFVAINYNPSSGEEAVGVAIGAGACMVLFIIVILVMITYTGFTLHKFKGSGKPRTFLISDEELKFIIPDKPFFQIQWSKIATVQIHKARGFRDFLKFKTRGEHPDLLILDFYATNSLQFSFGIERGVDFHNLTTDRIISLIEQYANRLHKEYIWGK